MTAPVPTQPRRLVYLGNPAIAVAPLLALHEASDRLGMEVVVVVTAENRRRSRRGQPTSTPVGAAAADLGLPVVHDLDAVVASGADLGVIVAYGRIIPLSVLDFLPMLNLHFSLLPRWRGAAPVERAILAGDAETGVCLMDVAEELDTGVVRCRVATPVGSDESADELRKRLAGLGSTLLVDALAAGSAKANHRWANPRGPTRSGERTSASTGPGPPRNSIVLYGWVARTRPSRVNRSRSGRPPRAGRRGPGPGPGNSSVTWWPSAPSTDRLRGRAAASG